MAAGARGATGMLKSARAAGTGGAAGALGASGAAEAAGAAGAGRAARMGGESGATDRHRRPVGVLLREWRERRRRSQLDLALDAEVSTRHLSFVETGRSVPSREMVLRLAEQLELPLRERNRLLLAAGYAPVYHARALDDPALRAARAAIVRVLEAHEPFPALAV